MMMPDIVKKLLWFVGLLLFQVLLLNQIHLGGFATPFFYVYFILKQDTAVGRNQLLLWAFVMGLLVDMFLDVPGVNAAASVFVAMVRPSLLSLFMTRDMQGSFTPSFRMMGIASFIRYVMCMLLIHAVLVVCLEYFSLVHLGLILTKIVCSTLLTSLLVFALEGFRKS